MHIYYTYKPHIKPQISPAMLVSKTHHIHIHLNYPMIVARYLHMTSFPFLDVKKLSHSHVLKCISVGEVSKLLVISS